MVLPVSPASSFAPDFRPTHVVPRGGMPAWEAPDPNRPTEPLDPFLPVQLLDRVGDWGRILCSNGWSAWVDGRLLVSVPPDPPAAGQPPARAADPRPLLARAEESLARYRRAAEDLAAGRMDGEGFRGATRGLRVGMVVDGEAMWLYDAEHERWVHCDGTRLSTYAASAGPSAAAPVSAVEPPTPVAPAAPGPGAVRREPTQVVGLQPPKGSPEAARLVERDDEAARRDPGPEATRLVERDDESARPDPGPEATRLVDRDEDGRPSAAGEG